MKEGSFIEVSDAPKAANSRAEAGSRSLEAVLEKYRTVSGLVEIEDMVFNGCYIEEKREFFIKLLAKTPNWMRKTLEDDVLMQVCSYHGETAIVEVEGPEGTMHEQALPDTLYQQTIILEGAYSLCILCARW